MLTAQNGVTGASGVMRALSIPHGPNALLLVLACALAARCPSVRSQDILPVSPPAPSTPLLGGFGSPSPGEISSAKALEERLRATEEMNRTLTERLEQLNQKHRDETNQLIRRLDELSGRLSDPDRDADRERGDGDELVPTDADMPLSVYDYSGPAADESVPDYFDLDVTSPYAYPGQITFGPGFEIQSAREEFRLQIHYESQIEGRIWSPEDQLPANSGFFLPRQRFFFNGNITKAIEYEVAINRGVNNINLLNAFINFHFDDRFQVRVGRFFTPLFYDQFAISNYWLPTPERSLFTTNLSLNRQIGAAAWGYLFDKRLDYAAGVFNGSRNSFESLNNGLDFVGFLNARPFQNAHLPFAENWNVGASVAFGRQDQAPVPVTFRVGAASPDANVPGIATVPFLILNRDVREQGDRLIGSIHMAYFYRSLSVIGEWQYGHGNYVSPGHPVAEQVPFSGFYVTTGYFLTGEHIRRRTRLKPLRPLVPVDKNDERGLGAWEAVARVSQLRLGDEFFAAGLADPAIWSSTATTTELGVNWYWNDYLKFYLFWLHAAFEDPVQYRPGGLQKHADMFWLRGQLYF